jgi:hypothetical protein
MSRKKKTVEISKLEYQELLRAEAELSLLHNSGVDNWEWYGEALEGLDEEYDEIDAIIENLD